MSVETHELTMLAADARKMPLEDGSVQCIVTSPPYWGLRKYAGEQELVWGTANGSRQDGMRVTSGLQLECEEHGHLWAEADQTVEVRTGNGLAKFSEQYRGGGKKQGTIEPFTVTRGTCLRCGAWRGAYGLEPTIEMYIAHTVEILRECRRVLRSDGVLFWNVGDSYAGGGNGGGGSFAKDGIRAARPGSDKNVPLREGSRGITLSKSKRIERGEGKWGGGDNSDVLCKPKDLCLIPARVALAAQADGWWVRSLIIWSKPNPMPESVTDRPTDSYEHIIMLTKSARYFWDADAVREPQSGNAHSRGSEECNEAYQSARESYYDFKSPAVVVPGGRNMLNVWNFPTQPYAGAHFATFPEEIPRRAILAATSARGCCTQCAAPWERVTHAEKGIPDSYNGSRFDRGKTRSAQDEMSDTGEGERTASLSTIGFRPTCRCRGQRGRTAPCVVLDPFGGSGTTGRVAIELGRRAVLLDIAYSAEYAPLAAARTSNVQRSIVW